SFGSAPVDRYLPYAFSDRRARQSAPGHVAFISLVALPDSRSVSEDLHALLFLFLIHSGRCPRSYAFVYAAGPADIHRHNH
ncbi:hypothetical protein JQN47_26685, partial [Escherichia coli]|nr:hypothetical protein [Escherichia coli]